VEEKKNFGHGINPYVYNVYTLAQYKFPRGGKEKSLPPVPH